ncbi:MAG TPA: TlpA disulfide reductase family protein [Polyangiaceae bacterium]|nr:TlpA disulfide reductase family protein [Polyangiaceae bacterium]
MVKRHDRTEPSSSAAQATPEHASSEARKPGSKLVRLRRLGLELAVIALVFFGLGMWQTRGLLPRGEPLPEFHLVDLEGKRATLSDYRGKTLLVHLWATWCGVCRQEFAALNALHQNLGDDEALVSIVADGHDRARLERFVREHRIQYPVLLGTRDLLESYKVEAFPTNYYVDGTGLLRDKTVGLSTRLSMGARMACTK